MTAVAEMMDKDIGTEYSLADALGSTIALTDENGDIKTRYNYTPFGEPEVSGDASDNPFMFTGREYDRLGDSPEANEGTGLYYYRARYYSWELGRFISEDPIGLAGGINMYAYVLNNPIRHTDPHGELVQLAELIVIGGIIVATVVTVIILNDPKYQEASRALSRELADSLRAEPTECEDDPEEDDRNRKICETWFDLCMGNPWQPKWNQKIYGKRKDCRSCRVICLESGGNWPFYKCPA